MSPSSTGSDSGSTPWFRRWFGEEYLDLYPHRDEAEAERAVHLLLDHAQLHESAPLLDLACGAGRHLRCFTREGVRTMGLDLSETLLEHARATGYQGPLVQADMRSLPFAAGAFGAVTSYFTSFGYFRSDEDDDRVLSEIARILRPDGYLLLDFLNAERVRKTLRARDEEVVDGRRVVQERRLVNGGAAVEKRIRIEGGTNRASDVFHERVRLYSPEDLEALLSRRGFLPLTWFGDYAGGPPQAMSPRTIVLARAAVRPSDDRRTKSESNDRRSGSRSKDRRSDPGPGTAPNRSSHDPVSPPSSEPQASRDST